MDSSSRVENITIEINSDDMQTLQDTFCKSTDMYMMCFGKTLGNITSFSGSKAEEDFVDQHFSKQLQKEILDSFIDGGVENVVERKCEDAYCMCRGVAIRGEDGKYLGAWLCFGLNKDRINPEEEYIPSEMRLTTGAQFDKSISLLEVLTKYYFSEKMKSQELSVDLKKTAGEERQMERRLLKNEVMTEILRNMESGESFTKLTENILAESVKYLNCSNACIIKLNPDEESTDVVSEWPKDKSDCLTEAFKGLQKDDYPFMTGRPYTISSDSMVPDNFDEFFKVHGIQAGIFLPLNINSKAGMYLCFLSIGQERRWSVDDLKFVNDVKRVIHTVLVKRITKNSLASSYSALESILENTGCGVAVTDVKKRECLYSNEAFEKMFEDQIDRLALDELLYDRNPKTSSISGYSATNSGRWYDIKFSTIKWVDGREVKLSTFYDISELKNYQRRIEKQASEDYLTGVFNRQRCELDLDKEIHFAKRTKSEFAVMLLDLDDFANINEALGYSNGDKLLQAVGHAINNIEGIKNRCYRMGGDEFLIIVDHAAYPRLEEINKRIYTLFENAWKIGDKDFYCTMSMGICDVPKDGDTFETLVQRLNIAVIEAKNQGKNRHVYYDDHAPYMAQKRLEMEKAMRKAVAENSDEFEVYYQPLINVGAEGAPCCGAEALVRWNSKELGMITPDEFISLAEYLGLIIPIGEKVLLEACKRCKYWNDFGHPEYKVNVNLSVVQLVQTDVVEVIKNVLDTTNLNPHNLTVEITESLAINDMEKTNAILNAIRGLGCRIALDDFGTGYSSLNHIRSMPIDTVKIDRAFVKDMETDEYSMTFIKAISELAYALRMDVCVEGVEEEEQKELIERFDSINLIQGFIFDKPLKVEDFERKYLL